MKVLAFKPLVALLAVALTMSTADVFADPYDRFQGEEKSCQKLKIRLKRQREMLSVIEKLGPGLILGGGIADSLITVITAVAFDCDPDPKTNPKIRDLIEVNRENISENLDLILDLFRNQEFTPSLESIKSQILEYLDNVVTYSVSVSINNKQGERGSNEQALAATLTQQAEDIGAILSSLLQNDTLSHKINTFNILEIQEIFALNEVLPISGNIGDSTEQLRAALDIKKAVSRILIGQQDLLWTRIKSDDKLLARLLKILG